MGYYLKIILNILMSLCNDLYLMVYYWVLEVMGRVSEVSGLGFGSYVSVMLGVLGSLYFVEMYNVEMVLLVSMNLEVEYGIMVVIVRGVDSLINVFGLDL